MKLEHIALNITDSEDVKKFYQNILGMIQIRNYELGNDLAKQLFDIYENTSVYLMQKENLVLELFVNAKLHNHGFNHICIGVKNRENIVKKTEYNSYKCIRIKREYFDQIFISDNSGNMFEIKETN